MEECGSHSKKRPTPKTSIDAETTISTRPSNQDHLDIDSNGIQESDLQSEKHHP
jgi:hypothetical protein